MMDKTAFSEWHRLFLIHDLPQPITRSSTHLQVLDRYITGTRLRVRRLRDPGTRMCRRILQHQTVVGGQRKTVQIDLNGEEAGVLERLDGAEVRKNRYFYESDGTTIACDIYLGRQDGLATAKAYFDTEKKSIEFLPPPFAAVEVTGLDAFYGAALAERDIAQLKNEIMP